jgi:hypothetical protein
MIVELVKGTGSIVDEKANNQSTKQDNRKLFSVRSSVRTFESG